MNDFFGLATRDAPCLPVNRKAGIYGAKGSILSKVLEQPPSENIKAMMLR
jgi:hypothetical protein